MKIAVISDYWESEQFTTKTYCEANGLTYRNAQGVLEGKQAHHKNYKFARLEN